MNNSEATLRFYQLRRFGGTVALSVVALFWGVAVGLRRLGHGPVANPLLDVIFVAYIAGSPVLAVATLVVHKRTARDMPLSARHLPLQAWLAFLALMGWVTGLAFLDLR